MENTINETLHMFNGNDQPTVKTLPRLLILGYINPTALKHITKQTGLNFIERGTYYEAQPESSNQIVRLFLTYNFKTQYHNNGTTENTIYLKSDHHVGFDVDAICFDCTVKNRIVTNGLKQGDFLAC